jgi:hypothetical protein
MILSFLKELWVYPLNYNFVEVALFLNMMFWMIFSITLNPKPSLNLTMKPTWQSRFHRITGLHKIMIWTWFEFTIWFAFLLIIVGIWGGSEWTCKCCLFYVDFCRSMCSMFFIILMYWKCPQLIFSLQSSSTWRNPNPLNSNWLSISMFLARFSCSNKTKKKIWS